MRTRPLAAGLAALLLLVGFAALGGAARAAPATCENGVAVPDPEDNRGLVLDCANLLAAKTLLDAPTPLNWGGEAPITEWDGVTVGGEPSRVRKVELSSRGLRGRVPARLGALTALRELALDRNRLTGRIPPQLGGLRNLELLWMNGNRLTGSVPAEIGALSGMRNLWLSDNQLSGPIPAALGSLTELRYLALDDNQLHGTIPAGLGSLAGLESLNLSGNRLRGPIPATLGSLSVLEFLLLDDNALLGAIPRALGGLSALRHLALDGNRLVGAIPTTLGALSELRGLGLSDNQLTGAIPPQLGGLAKLASLRLNGNRLSGPIPLALASLRELDSLSLDGNQLTGPIPAQLAGLPKLRYLWLSGNQLGGLIPPAFGALPDLRGLGLSDNRLRGPIPASFGSLAKLRDLWLSDNQLSGPIPRELRVLGGLHSLSLAGNAGLGGCIPPVLRELPRSDVADLGLADCAPVLAYGRLDPAGAATTPGSYAFLDGAGHAIRTYEGLRAEAASLNIHHADAAGRSRAGVYATIAAGDVVEWRRADDCWVRYRVTETPPVPPDNEPRSHVAIGWLAHAAAGCAGPIAVEASAATVEWRPPPNVLVPAVDTPIRVGSYLFVPAGWRGPFEEEATVAPPDAPGDPADAGDGAEWPSADPDVARRHPLWAEPGLPDGWRLYSVRAERASIEALYADSHGHRGARIRIVRPDRRPLVVDTRDPHARGLVEEVRMIDGHTAYLRSDLLGVTVRVFDDASGVEYVVYLSGGAGDPAPRDIEAAVALVRSLYR